MSLPLGILSMRSRHSDLDNPAPRAHRPVLGQRERHGVAGPRGNQMPRKARSIADRLWEKVSRGPGCWLWQGTKGSNGYGLMPCRKVNGFTSRVLVHRLSWMLFRGDPGDGLVLHRCDVRNCVNPSHLFLGDHTENVRDMMEKGRHPKNGTLTSYKCGHPKNPWNSYYIPKMSGKIHARCRVCWSAYIKRRYHESKEASHGR